MNMPMHQAGNVPMNQMVPSNMPQLPPGQPPMHHPMQYQDKIDSITKIKSLVISLRESLSITLKSAAQTLHQNNLIDSSKAVDPPDHRFNKHMEEFYSICDQIELQLKMAIQLLNQNTSAMRYNPIPVMPSRSENITNQDYLTYPQFLMMVRSQIQYCNEIHDLLVNAAGNIANE